LDQKTAFGRFFVFVVSCQEFNKGLQMIKVGIVGGTGYTGVELLRLLALHTQVNLQVITSPVCAVWLICCLFIRMRHFLHSATWYFSQRPTASRCSRRAR
jgi:hypothetical protein